MSTIINRQIKFIFPSSLEVTFVMGGTFIKVIHSCRCLPPKDVGQLITKHRTKHTLMDPHAAVELWKLFSKNLY